MNDKSFVYVKCVSCILRGTAKCLKNGLQFSPSVIPGCMVRTNKAAVLLGTAQPDSESPNPIARLASRLRRNAASMEHGDAEADVRAAADILDSFADAGEVEYSENPKSPFRDMHTKNLVSPRLVAQSFSRAYVRAWERMVK